MAPDQEHRRAHRDGVSKAAVDAVVVILTFIIGVVMIVDNYRLGAGWAKDGPESGYFPLRIGAIICIASAVIFARTVFGKNRDAGIFVARQSFRQVLLVLVPTIVYVALIQFAGIYVASTLFIAAFMRVMDKYGWLKIAAISVGVNATLFWLFEVQFLIPLPKGPLEAWFGY
jgi:putative tricarboxylic transport membrane protein